MLTRWLCPSRDDTGNGTMTAYDQTANAVNLTLVNTSWTANTGSGGIRALSFNGSTSRGTTLTSISASATVRTLSAWIYCADPSRRQGIMGTRPPTISQGWVFLLNGTNTLRYFHTAGANLTVTTTIAANTWYHVAVVLSGGTVTMYKNGVSIGTQTGFIADNTSTFPGCVGAEDESYSSGVFSGLIDDVKIYNTALTAMQIASLAVARNVADSENLILLGKHLLLGS